VVEGGEPIAATFLRTIPPPPKLPNGLVFEIEGVEVAVRPHFMTVMVSTQRP
jgi:hypothetical protein